MAVLFRGVWATVLTTIVTIFLLPASAGAETRALLVGSWQFNSTLIMDLAGPANDLQEMETMVRAQGATDVTVLRNEGVSRTTVETALHALGLRSKPGDWIFFYYTGHGALAEAAVKGTRDGDTDQFLPLPGFDPDHEDPERYIVDKDFYNWLARYIPRDVQIFMMTDTCHSGTMHRSVDPRAMGMTPRLTLGSRSIELTSRPAPRFASVLTGTDSPVVPATRDDLPNLFFIAAAKDDQIAWENSLPVEGAPSHGFLTWSFEQGLTQPAASGKTVLADTDGDGKVSVGELGAYLNVQVRMLSGQRQESNTVIPPGRENQALFGAVPAPPAPLAPLPLPGLYVADVKARASVTGVAYPWRVLTEAKGADFVWDSGKAVMLRRTGDVVAQNVKGLGQVRGVIDKWAAMEALRPFLSEGSARVMVGPLDNGARYPSGAPVTLALDRQAEAGPAAPRYATVFNVASDGTVQRLYPTVASDGAGELAPGQSLPILETQAIPPYGTDHVVALVTPTPPDQFRLLLRTIDNQRAAGRLVAPIRELLAKAPGQASLSIGELYTGN